MPGVRLLPLGVTAKLSLDHVPKDMAKVKAQNDLRSAFHRETYPKYYESVRSLMMIHDIKLVEGNTKYGPPPNDKDWEPITRDLAELDNLCKTKYAGMTNYPDHPRENELLRLPATWCAIAANRVEYEKRGRAVALRSQFLPLNVEGELKAAMTSIAVARFFCRSSFRFKSLC